MTTFDELADAPYVSLATFRKSGAMVATPVWCAAVDDGLWVFSESDAGKVKRLRNSNQARMACCTFNGTLTSDWVDATALVVDDPAEIERALAALQKKYGWQMWLANAGSKLTGKFHRRAYLRINLS